MMSEKQKTTILDEFKNSLKEVLNDSTDFAEIREAKAALDFYKKSKEGEIEPSAILAKINDHIINNLPDSFVKEFFDALEKGSEGITLSFDKDGTSFSYSLPDIAVSMDFDLVINETGTTLTTITLGALLETDFTMRGEKSVNAKLIKTEFSANLFLFTKMLLGKKKKQIASRKFNIGNILI